MIRKNQGYSRNKPRFPNIKYADLGKHHRVAKPSEWIKWVQELPRGSKVVLLVRVPSHLQDWLGNLWQQEKRLRKEGKKEAGSS